MRLLILALLFCGFSYGQDVTTIHFNYKWNTKNEYKSLNKLKNTKVQYAYVEDQSDLIKQSIKSVPTIMVYRGNKPVAKFEAGLTMKIVVPLDSLQKVINKYIDQWQRKEQDEKNKICPAGIAWAKRTFDTYPSAYANMAASKYCKDPNYAKKSKK